MANLTQRYPLATPDGVPIPLEVIRPYGIVKQAFTTTVSGNITLAAAVEIASFYATEDCIVRFGAAASNPADGVTLANAIFIPKGSRVTCAVMAVTFTVIALLHLVFFMLSL